MNARRPPETLRALCLRHSELLSRPYQPLTAEIGRLHFLNGLASVQLDLLPLYTTNDLAHTLYVQLEALAKETLSPDDLRARLLGLLRRGH